MMKTLVALELQPIRAKGLQQALAGCEDLRLAASELTPELALKRVAETCPAVVLVDGDLGAGRIASFLKAIHSVSPRSQPVLWIPEDGGGPELEAMASSGIATLKRTAPVHRVLEVLRSVARNPRDIAKLAIGRVHFTAREQEILNLLCQGLKNSDIARVLRISPSTVKVHLSHMYDKSGIHNRGLLAALLNQWREAVSRSGKN
jgi:DNA-binding NarL/FixJ family response regulator